MTIKQSKMTDSAVKFLAVGLLMLAANAQAALRVVTCEPEWASLASELGGDRVSVSSMTTGRQDPHRIQARPSLIARTRNTDLLVCTGAELEAGWLPVLLSQSGNAKVQPGQPGFLAASDLVRKLEVPISIDRAQGDVHSAGNPHIQSDPRTMLPVADALTGRFKQLDPVNAGFYAQRLSEFRDRWQAAIARWEAQAAMLRGTPVVTQHRAFVYLYAWLGLKEVAVLEPTPGVEPSVAHLQAVLMSLKSSPAKIVITASYLDSRASRWLGERAGLPVVSLPLTVGSDERTDTLFALFDETIARLVGAVKTP
jgi:zinc/manganese transport system substrate-binding protein